MWRCCVPEAAAMIEVHGLAKRFSGIDVLRGIDLSVSRGEVVAIIGPSGSGKTTLLRCLNWLEVPSAGTIRIGATEIDAGIQAPRQKARIRQLRLRAAFVFQNFNLFPHMTALENVIEGPVVVKRERRDQARARGLALLARVGLAGREDVYPQRLSGGQQQRVAIARALATRPALLLADEPTGQLDRETGRQIMRLLRAVVRSEGVTALVATHDPVLIDLADSVLQLTDGKISD
jgi:cystine transport system ATP-binding protein